jgi:small basic protein (TIGR04137 family)
MSMDRSLKSKANLSRHRNVLTRDERIKILEEQEKRRPGDSATGLQKVAHRKATVGAKVKKAKDEAGADGAAAPAAGAAPGGAKAAAPGAKAAAPAAKKDDKKAKK